MWQEILQAKSSVMIGYLLYNSYHENSPFEPFSFAPGKFKQ